jgi:two-component system response regulator YesN
MVIIDDEDIVRDGLRCLIDWEANNFSICGEASDGSEGLDLLVREKPDFALIDIRMPGLNGIEVMKRANELNLGTRFLVLSGFADFEYARNALSCGACGYIVKPVDEDELIQKIKVLDAEIAQDRVISRQIEDGVSAQKNRALKRIIAGDFDEGQYPEMFPKRTYQAAAMVLMGGEFESGAPWLESSAITFFPKDRTEVFAYYGIVFAVFCAMCEEEIRTLLDRFYERHSSFTFSIVLAPKGDGVAGIRDSCLAAAELAKQSFFFHDAEIITSESVASLVAIAPGSAPVSTLEDSADEICSYIQISDTKKIETFFDDFEKFGRESGKTKKEITQECVTFILRVRSVLLSKNYPVQDTFGSSSHLFDLIASQQRFIHVVDILKNLCFDAAYTIAQVSAGNSIQRVVSYVMNNYTADLKVETLAQLFNYSSVYLGQRFKEHTGKTIHTFIDELRIESAKRMLLTTDKKVYEISELIGYASTDYFYAKFKKYTGMSPLDVRRKIDASD